MQIVPHEYDLCLKKSICGTVCAWCRTIIGRRSIRCTCSDHEATELPYKVLVHAAQTAQMWQTPQISPGELLYSSGEMQNFLPLSLLAFSKSFKLFFLLHTGTWISEFNPAFHHHNSGTELHTWLSSSQWDPWSQNMDHIRIISGLLNPPEINGQ